MAPAIVAVETSAVTAEHDAARNDDRHAAGLARPLSPLPQAQRSLGPCLLSRPTHRAPARASPRSRCPCRRSSRASRSRRAVRHSRSRRRPRARSNSTPVVAHEDVVGGSARPFAAQRALASHTSVASPRWPPAAQRRRTAVRRWYVRVHHRPSERPPLPDRRPPRPSRGRRGTTPRKRRQRHLPTMRATPRQLHGLAAVQRRGDARRAHRRSRGHGARAASRRRAPGQPGTPSASVLRKEGRDWVAQREVGPRQRRRLLRDGGARPRIVRDGRVTACSSTPGRRPRRMANAPRSACRPSGHRRPTAHWRPTPSSAQPWRTAVGVGALPDFNVGVAKTFIATMTTRAGPERRARRATDRLDGAPPPSAAALPTRGARVEERGGHERQRRRRRPLHSRWSASGSLAWTSGPRGHRRRG